MSVARHHAEWLSLTETSGPFLSLSTLLRAFPQELDTLDGDTARRLRSAHEEWQSSQEGRRPDAALHTAWIRFVLTETLGFPAEVLADGQAIPPSLTVPVSQHVEQLRPDLMVVVPEGEPEAGAPRLLISTYPSRQKLTAPVAGRAWSASPQERMADLLRGTGVKLGLVTNGEQWMLVSACTDTAGFASSYASLWREEPLTLRAFVSLLGVRRFFGVAPENTLAALLTESAEDQAEVTTQLGAQVRHAVEVLVQSIDRIDKDRGRTLLRGADEKQLYQAAVTAMMRLVILLSAEERGLLLLGDELYDQYYAVSTLRAQLRETADQQGEEVLERRKDAWSRLLATFRAVYGGVEHEAMRLPAYGGGLFDPDRYPFLEGRAAGTVWRETPAAPLPIHNRTVLHLLDALQVLQVKVPGGGPAEARRLSFRALDVEQLGHVYEGLLDHTAVRANQPVLGLLGTKNKEPEIALSELETLRTKSEKELLKFLEDATGRSASALSKGLVAGVGLESADALLMACDNDAALYAKVQPWAGLLRPDTFGLPTIVTLGSVYVTQGQDRRATGTHYTPRSLTGPIVKRTLDPLLYQGLADGADPTPETLRSPKEILALKVCDMATGSGAFLVQACRYLSERLVEAWERVERTHPESILVTPEGGFSTGYPAERLVPADPEERLVVARRLIADRCLYGVDKNPMAVDMAKVSLWLTTLEKERPFTFLDHAIKCGDSLVGVDMAQLRTWSLDRVGNDALGIFSDRSVTDALEARLLLEQLPERTIADVHEKARLLALAETAMTRAKLAADLIVAPSLKFAKPAEQKKERERLRAFFVALPTEEQQSQLRATADEMLGDVCPFHWPLEFPEVFPEAFNGGAVGGFDAIVGNPPFIGGQRITGQLGVPYREYLVNVLGRGVKGSADIVAYFYLRGFDLIKPGGVFGLIATNTIAQGDTRQVGLDQIIAESGQIIEATPSMPWPGEANLEVAVANIYRGSWNACRKLSGRCVNTITAFLDDGTASGNPVRLKENAGKAFIGLYVLGMGFVLETEDAEALIARDPRNAEVLFPYLNGEDLNSRPDQSPSRWVINFGDRSLEASEGYPDCMAIVRDKVYPERMKQNDKYGRSHWWQFMRTRPELRAATVGMDQVLTLCRVTKYLSPVKVPAEWVCSIETAVFSLPPNVGISILQSTLYEVWVRQYTSTLETRLRYSPSDCFENFAFPRPNNEQRANLDRIGDAYHEHRRGLMLARQIGLTKAYNLFHTPACRDADIAELRRLHVQMDTAVRDAYGWSDLELGHDFHGDGKETRYTLAPAAKQEVLRRLLALNHARAAEEAAEAAKAAASVPVKSARRAKTGKQVKASEVGQTTTDEIIIDAYVKGVEARKIAQLAPENSAALLLTWLILRSFRAKQLGSASVDVGTLRLMLQEYHRILLVKHLYAVQAIAKIPLGLNFTRHKFGPYTAEIEIAEQYAVTQGWLKVVHHDGAIHYEPLPEAEEAARLAETLLGRGKDKAEKLLRDLDGRGRVFAEQWATIHMAWADAIAKGLEGNVRDVWNEIQEWKPDRADFDWLNVQAVYAELKQKDLLESKPERASLSEGDVSGVLIDPASSLFEPQTMLDV